MDSPCKNCTKRKIGCHSICDSYLSYRSLCDENIKSRHAEQVLRSHAIESIIRNVETNRRRHGGSFAVRNS